MSIPPLGCVEGWEDVFAASETRCPVNECGRRKRGIMCSSHWRLVEHDARAALDDAVRYYHGVKGFSTEMQAGAVARWEAAWARCIHAAEVHERG